MIPLFTYRKIGSITPVVLFRIGSCYVQGESRIKSQLHHIATSDIASMDVGPGIV